MRKSMPDDKELHHILDLICALDECIMKAERIDDLLIIYVNIFPYHRKAIAELIHMSEDASIIDFEDYQNCA